MEEWGLGGYLIQENTKETGQKTVTLISGVCMQVTGYVGTPAVTSPEPNRVGPTE